MGQSRSFFFVDINLKIQSDGWRWKVMVYAFRFQSATHSNIVLAALLFSVRFVHFFLQVVSISFMLFVYIPPLKRFICLTTAYLWFNPLGKCFRLGLVCHIVHKPPRLFPNSPFFILDFHSSKIPWTSKRQVKKKGIGWFVRYDEWIIFRSGTKTFVYMFRFNYGNHI